MDVSWITWPIAITIFGISVAVIGTIVAFLSFIGRFWKKPEDKWKDDLIIVNQKLHTILTRFDSNDSRMDLADERIKMIYIMFEELKDSDEKHKLDDERSHIKMNDKIDKLTDLIVEIIQEK